MSEKEIFSVFSRLSNSVLYYYYLFVMPLSLSHSFSSFLACLFLSYVNSLNYSCETLLNSKVNAELITGFSERRDTHPQSLSLSLALSLSYSDIHRYAYVCVYLIWNLLHLNSKNIITLTKMNGKCLCTVIFSLNGLFI